MAIWENRLFIKEHVYLFHLVEICIKKLVSVQKDLNSLTNFFNFVKINQLGIFPSQEIQIRSDQRPLTGEFEDVTYKCRLSIFSFKLA